MTKLRPEFKWSEMHHTINSDMPRHECHVAMAQEYELAKRLIQKPNKS